ncbi:hypothetical protein JCM24511_07046 [Saitozyma sp. JCM 24511]|nr:hypothetical protein JCM24511_07046 [Saitozyma sp. JCM 24511]
MMSESTTHSVWLKRDPADTSLSGTSWTLFDYPVHATIDSYSDDDPTICTEPYERAPNEVQPDFAIGVHKLAVAVSDEFQGEVRVDDSPAMTSIYWYIDDISHIDFDSHDDAVMAFDKSPCADIELTDNWKASGDYDNGTLPVVPTVQPILPDVADPSREIALTRDEERPEFWRSDWFFLGSSRFKTKDPSGTEFTGTAWIARQLHLEMDTTGGQSSAVPNPE